MLLLPWDSHNLTDKNYIQRSGQKIN